MGIGNSTILTLSSTSATTLAPGITEAIAGEIKLLQEAGCEYGVVSDLLDLAEKVFHGENLDEFQKELLLTAATAAPFVRQERIQRKIDNPN